MDGKDNSTVQPVSTLFTLLREKIAPIDITLDEISKRLDGEQRFLQTVITTIVAGAVTKMNDESVTRLYTNSDFFTYYYYISSDKKTGAKIGITVSFVQSHLERNETLEYDLLRAIEKEVENRGIYPLIESITVNSLQVSNGEYRDLLLEM